MILLSEGIIKFIGIKNTETPPRGLSVRELNEALNKALITLKEELKHDLYSVIVIGSISRPSEYVDGLSDTDMIVISARRPSTAERYRILENLSGFRVNLFFLKPEDVIKIIKSGYPLAWRLFYDSKTLYDNGTLERILKNTQPVINECTISVLKKSSLVALSVAVENYFIGYFTEGINWLHKSLKYGAQWLLAHNGLIPTSDAEIIELLKSVEVPPLVISCFEKLVFVRKRKRISNLMLRPLINTTVRALCLIYDVKGSDWTMVEMKMREMMVDGVLTKISAVLEENKLKWNVWILRRGVKVKEVIE